jgi:hypothetical protein
LLPLMFERGFRDQAIPPLVTYSEQAQRGRNADRKLRGPLPKMSRAAAAQYTSTTMRDPESMASRKVKQGRRYCGGDPCQSHLSSRFHINTGISAIIWAAVIGCEPSVGLRRSAWGDE